MSTKGCQNIDDFIKACKKELSSKLGSYDIDQLFLSLTVDGPKLPPGLKIKQLSSQLGYINNDDEHPLFIGTIEAATNQSNIFYLLK